MRPILNPCPKCGSGKKDNELGSKKELKISTHAPVKGAKIDKKGGWSVIIRCKVCGYQVGPIYQKKNDKVAYEPLDDLKQRVVNIWNNNT